MNQSLVDSNLGLSSQQAVQKLQQIGPNSLPEPDGKPLWLRFLQQFNSPLIYILLFAVAFDFAVWAYESFHGFPVELVTIILILLVNACLGVWQETKSEDALSKLKAMAAPQSWVYRDGSLQKIPSDQIVPGDVVRVEAGERIPADGKVIRSLSFAVDESVLTGESIPIEKNAQDELLSGSLAVRGSGLLETVYTGPQSNMGKLASLLSHVVDTETPLEARLDVFGRKVAVVVIVLAIAVLGLGLLFQGVDSFTQLFLFAVALAVAAVPESLPAVLTLAMALGVGRMAQRKAVVRRLTAVEALGSVTVIATDKTGTLTENKMHVDRIDCVDEALARKAMVLANDADPAEGIGDPLEVGLLKYAQDNGEDVISLRDQLPRVNQVPFDSAWKYMSVSVEENGAQRSYLKGAPDVLLEHSDLSGNDRERWARKVEEYNSEGFRSLALGYADYEIHDKLSGEQRIQWLGLVLLWDPPRQEIPAAIAAAQQAGIRVLMITGDHPATAAAIAQRIGIKSEAVFTGKQLDTMDLGEALQQASVFARVSPEHKLAIVNKLKEQEEIVAVTGDGVNDAPALKAADVGVAMGNRGSDVSREVADLVLLDDNFSTIVSAIREGRNIYENIQKFVRTLFSTNLTEVLLIALGAGIAFYLGAVDGRLLLPLTAVQILWVNLLTDSLPALAITADHNPGVMEKPPRPPATPLLDQPTLQFVLSVGMLGGLVALALLLLLPGLGYPFAQVQTTVFCYLVWVQMSFVLPARRVNLVSQANRWLQAALTLVAGAQLVVVLLPGLRHWLGLSELDQSLWLILGCLLFISWGLAEIFAYGIRKRQNSLSRLLSKG